MPHASCVSTDAASASPEEREVVCLRELAGHARRSGNLLWLRLANGTLKTFRNDPAACRNDDASNCIHYRLVGFHAASKRYLVFVSGYEDFQCLLVSARTGKMARFRNIPHFAPDGQTFFVTGYDGMYDNWLGIGSVAKNRRHCCGNSRPTFILRGTSSGGWTMIALPCMTPYGPIAAQRGIAMRS